MLYSGVKFKTKILSNKIPKDSRIKDLKYWCKLFHEKELAPPYKGGSYGNLSFRLKENEFVITTANTSLSKTEDDCFAKVDFCDFKRGIVNAHGPKNPSSESMVHYAIYKKRKDVNAVFHGHCDKILLNSKKLKIPETKKEEPYGTVELVDSILNILDDNNFLIMKNHGFLAFGKTIKEAGELTLNYLNQSI